jgi:hypothetical protein
MLGKLARGVFQVQIDKINKAISNFEEAKKLTKDTEKILHPQLLGMIDMQLSRAYAIRSLNTGGKVPALALILLESAEDKADKESIDDPYERHLVTGSLVGLVKGEYHNNRARSLIIEGKPRAALKELTTLEGLRQGKIGKHFTRSQIYLDILAAEAHLGLEEHKEAIKRVKSALISSQDINSATNFARIVDMHGRLLQSPYKDNPNVKELGDMIHETITYNLEQEEEQSVEEQDY